LEVQALAAQRQPAVVQSRLSEATALLSLLSADALMKLGEVERARYWYGTARLAADDTLNVELRASVRAQQAMLPYYYGQVEQTVRLAREAQALVQGVPCHPAALAAAAEARALARLGRRDDAEQAMRRAQSLLDVLDGQDEDVAFRFTEKRLLLYLSGTLTYLGQRDRARRVQEQALARYSHEPSILIDPALIQLDQAVGEAAGGDSDGACQLATTVIQQLPAEHRTRIVLTRARDVVRAAPSANRRRPLVSELRELVRSQEAISP
jgi:tetratricopeptide (TPR) repeat protein